MDGSRRPDGQPDGRPRSILSPYDPVHASISSATPVGSQRRFLHRHQENIDVDVDAITRVADLYPDRLPSPSSLTTVGFGPVGHHQFVQLHPPSEQWLLPGMSRHPLLPVSFPHSSQRSAQAPTVPSEPGIGRDHLSFNSNSVTGVGMPGLVPRDYNPMPFSPTEHEHGNLERERNYWQTGRMLSHPPGLPPRGHGYAPPPTHQRPESGERQYNHHPRQPPTNMHASAQHTTTIQLIPPPALERRRQQFMSTRSRRSMASQPSSQTSRVDRQQVQRTSGSNVPANRSRVEGHSRRNPPWTARAGPSFIHTPPREAYMMNASLVPTKPPPSKRALLSLEPVEISELSKDDRTCIICYNDFGDKCPEGHAETPLRLPSCKHVFGDRCIKKWLEDSDNCPYCRDRVGRVRTTESNTIEYVEVSRGSSDDSSDEMLQSLYQVDTPQLRYLPVYTRLSDSPSPAAEEQNRHRAWTIQSRNASTPNSETQAVRTPVERDGSMITPPPLAASEVDPTVVSAHTRAQNHLHREDLMETPPSTLQQVPAHQSFSPHTLPEHSVHVPRPRVMIRDVFGTFRTHASTQTMASPESPPTGMEHNIAQPADFPSSPLLFDSHPEYVPGEHPTIFLPSPGDGSGLDRPGRGRRC